MVRAQDSGGGVGKKGRGRGSIGGLHQKQELHDQPSGFAVIVTIQCWVQLLIYHRPVNYLHVLVLVVICFIGYVLWTLLGSV